MARLTRVPPNSDGDDSASRSSVGVTGAGVAAAGVATEVADPRAVRVRLAATSRLADEPPVRVAPPAELLRLMNPTVGVGPLGGAAVADPALDAGRDDRALDTDGVLAQGHAVVDGLTVEASIRPMGHGRHVLDVAGMRTRVVLEAPGPGEAGATRREVLVDGFRFEVEIEPERIAALRERATRGREAGVHGGRLEIRAIIPGKVVTVSIEPGDTVTAGQQLLVVEAMKMQNELRSPRDGTIDKVGVEPGVNIEVGDVLVVIS